MKESENIKDIPLHTAALLSDGRYKDSIDYLRQRLTENPQSKCLGTLNQAESTLRYLLRYFGQGADDPQRYRILADIRRTLLDIADTLDREMNASASPLMYFSTLRLNRMRAVDIQKALDDVVENKSMSELAITAGSYPLDALRKVEDTENALFEAFWIADAIPSHIYQATGMRIASGAVPDSTACLIISGVSLGLMKYYNHDALMMLCELTLSDNIKIKARAIVSLMLALDRWSARIDDDVTLLNRLAALADTDGMAGKIRSAVYALMQTRDTERITRKLQKEVIPGLMQFGPEIINRLKNASQETSLADMEGNPEWERLMKNSGLEDKIKELTELQSDGADVMMVAFSNLKGFPFFRSLSNWMRTFSTHHTMLNSLMRIGDNDLTALMEINGMMCDSDKYSFAFSLSNMPEMQRDMMMSQLKGQMEQIREQMKDFQLLKAGREFEDEAIRYCRDLYRFHKLHPKHQEFFDPFARFISFSSLPVFADIFKSGYQTASLAEFYFKRGYYAEAKPLLEELAFSSADQSHVWEKIGFCCEKLSSDPDEAVEAYMKAQLFNPESKWIARRLALCYRRKGDLRNAADYLKMSLPDDGAFDRRISLMLAEILMADEKWDEALKQLYRIDYETPGDSEVVRLMARCAFGSGDFEKAAGWLEQIPNIDKSEDDYRMLGHISFLRHDIPGAMRHYRMTVRQNDPDMQWKQALLADIPLLQQRGGDSNEMRLLIEYLSFNPED